MAQLKDSVVSGNLRVTDTTLTDTLQVTTVKAPTSAGGTTYGPGSNGQVLKSNGSSVYWGADSVGAVTGVKGSEESTYRTGNVSISAANVGALPTSTLYAGSSSVGGPASKVATEVGNSAGARNVFYAYLGDNNRLVYDTTDRFTYNPSGGVLTATNFSGKLNGMSITGTNGSSYNLDNFITSDTKVTQTITDSSNTSYRPIILGYDYASGTPQSYTGTTVTNTTYAAKSVLIAPKDGNLYAAGNITAAKFIGPLQGNADTATSATKATGDESGNNIKATYAASFSISDHTITLKNKNGTSLGTVTVPDNNTTYGISGAYGDSNNNTWKTTITAGGTGTSSTVPTASTSAYGITKLYNGVDSTSTNMAATANAVKTAYDKANHSHNYLPLSGGTISSSSFGPLMIERTGSTTNGAGIKFKNDSGVLGAISMQSVNGNLLRWNGSLSTSYTFIDTGNISTYIKASTNNGQLNVNGSDVTVYTHPSKTQQSTSNFYKITVDSTGHVTTGDALSASNLPSHTHNYLPLAGGTMNTGATITIPYNGGNIEYSGGGITVSAPTASGWARGFDFNANSTYCGSIGARGDANAFSHFYIGLYSDPIVKLYPDKSTYFYGTVHLKANQYELDPVASAMNCHNSNITGVNAVIFEDDAGPGEGLMFYRSSTTWDSIWASGGELYFTPNYPTNTTNRYVIHTGNLSTYVKASSTNGQINVNGSDVTVYTHPTQTSKSSGLYKITVDGTGHVSAATAATSSDLPSHTHTDEHIDHSTTYRKNIYTANPLNAIMRLANHRNRANKLAFLPYGKIDIKYSTNGGSSWTDAGVSDATKAKLFTGLQSDWIYIGPNNSTTARTTSMKTQITITSERAIVLDQLYLLFHSNSHQLTVDVKGATYNKTDYDSHKYVENFAIGTWAYNSVLDMSAFRFQTSETESSYISKLQITFSYTSVGSGDKPAQLFGILGYGGVDWWDNSSGPNNMAMYDHIYRWNENKETIFPADIYVGSTKVSLVGHTHNYTPYSTNPIDSSTTPSVSFNKDYSSNGITTSNLPKTWNMGFSAAFVSAGSGWGSFGSVFTLRTYGEGGGTLQMYVPYSPTYGGDRLKARFGNYDSSSGNSWTTLKEIAWLDDASKVTQTVTTSDNTSYRPIILGDYYCRQSSPSDYVGATVTSTTYAAHKVLIKPSTGDIYTHGNITLKNAGTGDSPQLIFRRGDDTSSYTDWMIFGSGGHLYVEDNNGTNSSWEIRTCFKYNGGINIYSKDWAVATLLKTGTGNSAIAFKNQDSNGNTVSLGYISMDTYSSNGGSYLKRWTANGNTSYDVIDTYLFNVTHTTSIGLDNNLTSIGYISGLTAAAWNNNHTDGGLITHYYSASWKTQIYQDYYTGQMAVRGKHGGSWSNWYRVLDEGNVNTALNSSLYSSTGTTSISNATLPTGTSYIRIWLKDTSGAKAVFLIGAEIGDYTVLFQNDYQSPSSTAINPTITPVTIGVTAGSSTNQVTITLRQGKSYTITASGNTSASRTVSIIRAVACIV